MHGEAELADIGENLVANLAVAAVLVRGGEPAWFFV